MIFSPDLNPLVGPLPGLRNYWCACGVMTAFSQAGAVGKVLTEWMTNGDPGLDFFVWDVTRYGDWAGRAYTMARTADMYSTRFQTHYPYEEREAGRPCAHHARLSAARGSGCGVRGELGYELYLPPEHQIPLFLALRGEGAELGLRCAGMRALGSLRLEKGFAGWGRELSPDYDPFQAGLGRFVNLDKDGFIGRDAALRAAEREPDERLVLFEIDADDTDPCADPWGGEPVLRDGEYVGYLTSAGYGHCAGRTLALGYVRSEAIASNAAYDVEVLGKPRPARRLDRPPIDPEGLRLRA